MISFRIATYNIHKCRGLDRRLRPRRIVEVLKETKADIIALQEVVGMDERERERNQVRFIAEELGFDFRIGENRRLHGGAYGNALVTNFPFVAEHNHDITWRKSEPRGCQEVVLSLQRSKAQLRIFNVHLGTSYFERRYQARRLLDVLGDQIEETSPRIVMGDFNEWPRGLATHLLEQHFNSAKPQHGFGRAWNYPGIFPLAHVDHIYHDPKLKLERVAVHRSRIALVASDHLPLVADFTYRP